MQGELQWIYTLNTTEPRRLNEGICFLRMFWEIHPLFCFIVLWCFLKSFLIILLYWCSIDVFKCPHQHCLSLLWWRHALCCCTFISASISIFSRFCLCWSTSWALRRLMHGHLTLHTLLWVCADILMLVLLCVHSEVCVFMSEAAWEPGQSPEERSGRWINEGRTDEKT